MTREQMDLINEVVTQEVRATFDECFRKVLHLPKLPYEVERLIDEYVKRDPQIYYNILEATIRGSIPYPAIKIPQGQYKISFR